MNGVRRTGGPAPATGPPESWPAVIAGGGPAGAAAAITIARAGVPVLLVERREDDGAAADAGGDPGKVCGGCLNARSIGDLQALGLTGWLAEAGRPLRRVRVAAGGGTARLPMGTSVAVGRDRLDPALRSAAEAAGATVRRGMAAEIGPPDRGTGARRVRLRPRTGPATEVRADVVLAADGLAGSSLRREPAGVRRRRRSLPGARIGIGTIAAWPGGAAPVPGELLMLTGDGGYLGLVRLADETVDLAAAVDPAALAWAGGPAAWTAAALHAAGLEREAVAAAALRLRGTPRLATHAARPAAPGLLRVGDGLAYAEPFSGEGIAWALAGGRLAGRRVVEAARAGVLDAVARRTLERTWAADARRLRGRQRACRLGAAVLRSGIGRRVAMATARLAPPVAGAGLRAIGRDPARDSAGGCTARARPAVAPAGGDA